MSQNVTFTVEYEAGHSYEEKWTKGVEYCPNCGKQEVWSEDGPGDYYEGAEYLCTACNFNFTMPSGSIANCPVDEQRLTNIRNLSEASPKLESEGK